MAISINMSALFGGIGQALANPVYRLYWSSNFGTSTGRWMYRTAVGWLTWQLTESTGWLGVVAFAETFPMVVFSAIAGAIADRAGYLRIIRRCQLATACVAVIFAATTLSGHITIELVVLLTALLGSLEALTVPARMAIIHSLVPRKDLSAAIALGSATFNAARFIGPAIAGALILWLNIGIVLALVALTFLQFFVVVMFIRVDEPERDRQAALSLALFRDMWQGMKYGFTHPGICFLLIMLGVTGVFIRPVIELMPGFAAQVFGRGPDGLAILMSSIGLGAMISGLWLAQRGRTGGLTRLVTTSLLIQGVGLLLFTVTEAAGQATGVDPRIGIWVGAFFLSVVGFYMLVGGVGSQTLMQNAVDSRMRARVMSLFIVISWGVPALGALAAGWIADSIGLPLTIGAGAVVTISVWLWANSRQHGVAVELEAAEPAPVRVAARKTD